MIAAFGITILSKKNAYQAGTSPASTFSSAPPIKPVIAAPALSPVQASSCTFPIPAMSHAKLKYNRKINQIHAEAVLVNNQLETGFSSTNTSLPVKTFFNPPICYLFLTSFLYLYQTKLSLLYHNIIDVSFIYRIIMIFYD